jgi:hypothetical protein
MPGVKITQLLNNIPLGQHVVNQGGVPALQTIRAGRPATFDGHRIQIGSGYQIAVLDNLGRVVEQANQNDVLWFLNTLSNISYPPSQYAQVKNNTEWRRIYQVQNRQLQYVANTSVVNGSAEESAPCVDCGMLLPMRLLEVDHQRPLSGGETEAVAKVFRAFQWTVGVAKGNKAVAWRSGLFVVHPKATRGFQLPPLSTLEQRYTLNTWGALFYSLAVVAGAKNELETACINSLLNLAPRCRTCNSSKSNTLKFS